MINKKFIAGVVGAAMLAPLSVLAHDKCDSLANATTAGGVLWGPLAGFQVGYYLAKFVDESTASASSTDTKLDQRCVATRLGLLSPEEYISIVSPKEEDPNLQYKFLWDASGDLVRASVALNQAVDQWQQARVALRDAQIDGDAEAARDAQAKMDAAHIEASMAFDSYRAQHSDYAGVAAEAAAIFEKNPPPVQSPLLTLDDVVRTSESMLSNGAPEFERRYFEEIGCVLPKAITANGILAPADRFVNDDVKPGTFISNGFLVSAASLYNEVANTFGGEVAENLDKILPPGFPDNEPLAVEMSVMTEGKVLANDLGIEPGTLQHTTFMLDLNLRPNDVGRFIDPWQWHWIVGKPWDWLFGFTIDVILDSRFPIGPQPQPSDSLRVIAAYDSEDDQVMGLGRGSQFIQELHFADGSFAMAKEQGRLPNASEMRGYLGGSMQIMDETGKQRLEASIDKFDPNPVHMPITLNGVVGENKLGVEPGTLQQASFMLDLKLVPVRPGIFIDPWWWHWVVGKNPWDWLRGFDIIIETNIPRPGDPNPWDRMIVEVPYDEPQLDMVMDLAPGTVFRQSLYFPAQTLNLETLPGEKELSQFSGGDFAIVDPDGNELLNGKFESLDMVAIDSDEDGVDDFSDNCASVANKDQRDTDRDGYGNDCDADLNNDGVVSTRDLGMFKDTFGRVGENLDADLNGDGVVNTRDLGKLKSLFGKEPGPSAVGMLFHK